MKFIFAGRPTVEIIRSLGIDTILILHTYDFDFTYTYHLAITPTSIISSLQLVPGIVIIKITAGTDLYYFYFVCNFLCAGGLIDEFLVNSVTCIFTSS